jgi:hypothetical protein
MMANTACAARMPRTIAGATILVILSDCCEGCCCWRIPAGDLLPFDYDLLSKEAGLNVTLACPSRALIIRVKPKNNDDSHDV